MHLGIGVCCEREGTREAKSRNKNAVFRRAGYREKDRDRRIHDVKKTISKGEIQYVFSVRG